jgi:hypothetical protein
LWKNRTKEKRKITKKKRKRYGAKGNTYIKYKYVCRKNTGRKPQKTSKKKEKKNKTGYKNEEF